jgi:hypothetical protein
LPDLIRQSMMRDRHALREEIMRAIVLLFGLFLTTVSAKADTISACDADKYVGKLVTVEASSATFTTQSQAR